MATQFFIIVCVTLLTYVCRINAVFARQLSCPEDCDCYFFQLNWVTNCSKNHLTSIPYEELDSHGHILGMNANFLKELEPFPTYINLRSLQLSENFLT